MRFPGQWLFNGLCAFVLALVMASASAVAAPFAALVMDARSGEVLYSENADTRLHPASLTKMMTLYITFQAIEHGEISLDTMVTVSQNAASEPPSRLGLKAGQKIALRYLIRAAAIKSANDAATAIGEAVGGSEAAFARRMNRTAAALGMTRSTFKNANGLTTEGHLTTARDLTNLGRHLFYDFPQYYNLFSRRSADAGMATVYSTNRRFLDAYEGADGIKTGYTNAAGFNLTASAQRGDKRIIATVMGGRSTAWRNDKMAELLNLGFKKAPNRAPVQKPPLPVYAGNDRAPDPQPAALAEADGLPETPGGVGKTLRLQVAVASSPRPRPRPGETAPAEVVTAMQDGIDAMLASVTEGAAPLDTAAADIPEDEAEEMDLAADEPSALRPAARPDTLVVAAATTAETAPSVAAMAEAPPAAPAAAPAPAPAEPQVEVAAADPALAGVSPQPRPVWVTSTQPQPESVAVAATVSAAPETGGVTMLQSTSPQPETLALAAARAADVAASGSGPAIPAPQPRPDTVILIASEATGVAPAPADDDEDLEMVSRVSTSGGRHWGISIGKFNSRYLAERALLQMALTESSTLDGTLRKVVNRKTGFDATFLGMTEEMAGAACRRIAARGQTCNVIGDS